MTTADKGHELISDDDERPLLPKPVPKRRKSKEEKRGSKASQSQIRSRKSRINGDKQDKEDMFADLDIDDDEIVDNAELRRDSGGQRSRSNGRSGSSKDKSFSGNHSRSQT